MLIGAMGMMNTFAYEVGDYIYTRNGRFKISGANLIQNGDFSNGMANWQQMDSTAIADQDGVSELFTLEEGAGPNGENCISVIKGRGSVSVSDYNNFTASFITAANLFISVPREASKQYVFTYKVRSGIDGTDIVTSNTYNSGRNANLMVFYASADGQPQSIAGSAAAINNCWEKYGNEWTEIAYDYTSTEEGFLSVVFANMANSSCYTDFGIYEVMPVGDQRLIDDCIDQLSFYQQHAEDFPEMQGDLADIIDQFRAYKENNDVTADELNGFIDGIMGDGEDKFITAFLNANTADVGAKFNNFFFNSGSASKKALTGWTCTDGGRWFSHAAHGTFASQHIQQEIQASYNLAACDYYQTASLPGGKYLYMVQAQANNYGQDGRGSSSNYRINRFSEPVEGIYAYIVNDNDTTYLPLTEVPTYRARTYMFVVELGEGAKTVGIHSPGSVDNKGGNYCFDNLQLRIFGADPDEIDYKANLAAYELAKNNMGLAIAAAQAVVDSTAFAFGKPELTGSIARAQGVLDTADPTTNIIMGDDETSKANIAYVKAEQDTLDVARRAMVKLNDEFVLLGKDIEKCKETIADENRPNGKDAFQQAINDAETFYNAAKASAERDSLGLMTTDANLLTARQDYLLANAAFATPADLYVVNNSFQLKSSYGWVEDGKTGNDRWQYGQDKDNFSEDGYRAVYNRGTGANDEKFMYQDVAITKPGVYEFVGQFAVHLSTKPAGDTNYDTGAKIYCGNDSIIAVTDSKGLGGQNMGAVETLRVRTVLNEVPAEGTLRIGFDRKAIGAVCNEMYIGSCHLLYYGPYDKYYQDSVAVVMKPTKDSLQIAINDAKDLRDEARNTTEAMTNPFTQAITTAQGVVDNANAKLDEVLAQFDALKNATEAFTLSGAWPAKGKSYDHSSLLRNPEFLQGYEGWTVAEGSDSLAVDTEVGLLFKHQPVTGTTVNQEVTGLKNGFYTFTVAAAFRYDWNMYWNKDNYAKENTWFYATVATADTTQVAIANLMKGGQLANEADSTSAIIYDGGLNMTIYNARHIHDTSRAAWKALFNAGLFDTDVPFTAADGKATVGFYVAGIPNSNSAVAFSNCRLLFWGDQEGYTNGIDEVIAEGAAKQMMSNAVFNLNGQMVGNSLKGLQKGLYIMNGKKYIVK